MQINDKPQTAADLLKLAGFTSDIPSTTEELNCECDYRFTEAIALGRNEQRAAAEVAEYRAKFNQQKPKTT